MKLFFANEILPEKVTWAAEGWLAITLVRPWWLLNPLYNGHPLLFPKTFGSNGVQFSNTPYLSDSTD